MIWATRPQTAGQGVFTGCAVVNFLQLFHRRHRTGESAGGIAFGNRAAVSDRIDLTQIEPVEKL
jgi:hypothetical protein